MTGFRMPAEWTRHERTWMSFPTTDGPVAEHERGVETWAVVANAILGYEPVTMLTPPDRLADARAMLDPAVEIVEHDLDDCWFRDNGPTFVVDDDGRLGAVHWTFNGWGGRLSRVEDDRAAAALVIERSGARRLGSDLVNEGGGIAVDGQGTLLVTETVQLDPARNPSWSRQQVEQELHRCLGTTQAVWLPRGLSADYGPLGTNGHVDIVAAFVAPGVVAVHHQPDPSHPDHEVMGEVSECLRSARDARGRKLQLVEISAPPDPDGSGHDRSYLNFAYVNGGLVLCGFDSPEADAAAVAAFARLFPGRRITQVDARPIFDCGGGIHCITQQQPAV